MNSKHQVGWVIESLMFGEEYDNGMKAALESRGNPYHVISPTDQRIRLPRLFSEIIIFHGSIQTHNRFKEIEIDQMFVPGSFATFENFRYSKLLSNWGNFLLNNQPVFAPMAAMRYQRDYYQALVGNDDGVFIRPDDGRKSFSGQVVKADEHSKWESLEKDAGSDSFVLVSTPQKITIEWRVLIANGEAVTGCKYRENGVFKMEKQFPMAVEALANQIARQAWQPDPAYMLDIGFIAGGLKVIEANTFSCSDFYVMDYDKIVDAVNFLAISERDKLVREMEKA